MKPLSPLSTYQCGLLAGNNGKDPHIFSERKSCSQRKTCPPQILRAICKNHNCPRPADTHLEPAQGRPQAAASAKPPKSSRVEGPHSHKSALLHSALLQGPSSHLPLTGSAPAPMVSLHMAQIPFVSRKGPEMKFTYYLGKVTGWRLPAKYDSIASGELRLQGQASDCLGKSRAFCLSSPAGSRQTEPRPSCGKQASFRTVPTHSAEAQGDFQAGWRVIGPAITSFFSVTRIHIEKKISRQAMYF